MAHFSPPDFCESPGELRCGLAYDLICVKPDRSCPCAAKDLETGWVQMMHWTLVVRRSPVRCFSPVCCPGGRLANPASAAKSSSQILFRCSLYRSRIALLFKRKTWPISHRSSPRQVLAMHSSVMPRPVARRHDLLPAGLSHQESRRQSAPTKNPPGSRVIFRLSSQGPD